ncbi:ATP-binding protein [Deinococcus radiophilus]|uniref:ATP-binding protein n=1 Tax=Deinococcus radiophilus TaxID=32062 RepID=A0A431W5X4_9DEIO|nr:ATP-binding protein [Deinococcus radiophilus]RTR30821.1 ATP-binding protein [Deinococcus radiophilus]UFA49403.1 ATP-binding protein [Deinococcus radiophilus]
MTEFASPDSASPPGQNIGLIMGTEDATPTGFWFAVLPGASVQMDDLVAVQTTKPDGRPVRFFGIVDHVRTRHEGVRFDSDVHDVMGGILPASVSYAARVLVTRVDPEDFIPPQPGDPVRHAVGDELALALSADKMDDIFAGGLLADGQVLPLNYQFVNGEQGGHINISGISGVATKTSYALFLLHSIFQGGVLARRQEGHNTRALIFNVKGEDLLHLDRPNAKVNEKEGRVSARKGYGSEGRYARLGLPQAPFQNVQFLAPPRSAGGDAILPDVQQRTTGVGAFVFSLREFCQRRMLPYVFSDAGSSLNLGFVIGNVEERLYRLAQEQKGSGTGLHVSDWRPEEGGEIPEGLTFNDLGGITITRFEDLISYIEFKLLEENDGEGDKKWAQKQSPGTLRAFVRRMRGVQKYLSPLIRGDLSAEQAERYRPNILKDGIQTTVVDIHNLSGPAQMFAVGVLLREVFEHKEKVGRRDTVFVVLDELNKYAPRDGDSPIKDVLLDIAERGRSLGIILIGAQQTASEVERRIVSNAAIRVVGRLDMAEAERPEYRFLPPSFRMRAGILQPGTMLVSQPDVPNPVLVGYPFPAWATRKDEAAVQEDRPEEEVGEEWLGL